MNRIIQLILFFVLIIIMFAFYNVYFNKDNKPKIKEKLSTTELSIQPKDQKENNLIKNLRYEISISENNYYQIMSELSEITYISGSEIILMKKVSANLVDENNKSIFITSDNANYNNTNYNTNFENNVEIKYLDNIIFAENMILDFKENIISIHNNVRYSGPLGNLKADNIKINLITKKIDVFMNKGSENIVITSNR